MTTTTSFIETIESKGEVAILTRRGLVTVTKKDMGSPWRERFVISGPSGTHHIAAEPHITDEARLAGHVQGFVADNGGLRPAVKPGTGHTQFVNQGDRDAIVLAVIDDEALVEYYMEKSDRTFLLICNAVTLSSKRSISLSALPYKWARAVVAQYGDDNITAKRYYVWKKPTPRNAVKPWRVLRGRDGNPMSFHKTKREAVIAANERNEKVGD